MRAFSLEMYPMLIDGKVMVPRRAEAEDGTIGDTWVELSPEDPDYAAALAALQRREKRIKMKAKRSESWWAFDHIPSVISFVRSFVSFTSFFRF